MLCDGSVLRPSVKAGHGGGSSHRPLEKVNAWIRPWMTSRPRPSSLRGRQRPNAECDAADRVFRGHANSKIGVRRKRRHGFQRLFAADLLEDFADPPADARIRVRQPLDQGGLGDRSHFLEGVLRLKPVFLDPLHDRLDTTRILELPQRLDRLMANVEPIVVRELGQRRHDFGRVPDHEHLDRVASRASRRRPEKRQDRLNDLGQSFVRLRPHQAIEPVFLRMRRIRLQLNERLGHGIGIGGNLRIAIAAQAGRG